MPLGPRTRGSVKKYWHLCPDFAINPERLAVDVYRPDREPEIFENPPSVAGECPVDGFVLDLPLVWDPLSS